MVRGLGNGVLVLKESSNIMKGKIIITIAGARVGLHGDTADKATVLSSKDDGPKSKIKSPNDHA